jgi:hypothetical protein
METRQPAPSTEDVSIAAARQHAARAALEEAVRVEKEATANFHAVLAAYVASQGGAVATNEAHPEPDAGPSARSVTTSDSIRARVLDELSHAKGKAMTVDDLRARLGVDDKQSIRDAARKLIDDRDSGVRRTKPGVFVFRGVKATPDSEPGRAPGGRRPLPQTARIHAAILEVLRSAGEPVPSSEIMSRVRDALGPSVDAHRIGNELWSLHARKGLIAKYGEGPTRTYALTAEVSDASAT